MKQMDRRLMILTRLREEVPLRAADLAEACECSVRTVYRDIDALCLAGIPVAAMPGEGYRLAPGFHLPPIAFTVEEAVQLLLGSDMALRLGTAAQREAAKAAAVKVEAVLGPETRSEVGRMRERIRVSGWMHREASPWLPMLQEALLENRVLHLKYHSYSPDRITERKVEPYQLVYYENDWHVVGYCRLREGMRDFRAGRILAAEVLDETFKRHPAVASEAQQEDWSNAREIRVWLDGSAVPWAREKPGFGLEREEHSEGGSVFIFVVRDVRRLMPWILSWGPSARVLSPPDVVAAMREHAEGMLRRYDEG
ncbi:MAG TPA: YafY family protein [Dehalococcoidia bacterium]|nr:YafY family protein [Dehalococcoidia bacterium]